MLPQERRQPRIWSAAENSTTWIQGFPPDILPGGLEAQVRFFTRGERTGLEIGGVIGAVPLLNGDTLQIVPKVGPASFFRMLLTAEGLADRALGKFSGSALWGSGGDDESVPALLARRFLSELAHIDADGPLFAREKRESLRAAPSGRLDLRRSAMRLRLRNAEPFACVRKERTFDCPENRVLAAAAGVAAPLAGEALPLEPWQASLAFKWGKAYVRKDMLRRDLAETALGLAEGRYGGPRGRYAAALTMARLILGQAGMNQREKDAVAGDALLVSGAALFEDYVSAVLSKAYKPLGLTVSKGGSPVQCLYDDGSFSLIPDIRISRGLSTLALGDAKYKNPDAGDHYQMAAYMRSYGVAKAFLLCPDYGEAKESITRRRASDGRAVIEIRLPLRDLDATEALLADLHRILPFPS